MRLHGVLVTFRRPAELAEMLDRLHRQSRVLDSLTIIDNDPTAMTEGSVRCCAADFGWIEYLPQAENLGPAGGYAIGMTHALALADDEDWIVLLDDNDPPSSSDRFRALEAFARTVVAVDPRASGVGLGGGRFDWALGRIERIPDEELTGPISVDYLGGSRLPMYRAGAVREVGVFLAELFFGLEELEYGLRLRRANLSLYADGSMWMEERRRAGLLGVNGRPAWRLGEPSWRRYYSLRNLIYILRLAGCTRSALRVTLVVGLGKPVVNLLCEPRLAIKHLRLGCRAVGDAWGGRLGRTIEPVVRAEP